MAETLAQLHQQQAYGFVQVLGALLLKSPFVFNPLSVLAMHVFIVAVAPLATIGPVRTSAGGMEVERPPPVPPVREATKDGDQRGGPRPRGAA